MGLLTTETLTYPQKRHLIGLRLDEDTLSWLVQQAAQEGCFIGDNHRPHPAEWIRRKIWELRQRE